MFYVCFLCINRGECYLNIFVESSSLLCHTMETKMPVLYAMLQMLIELHSFLFENKSQKPRVVFRIMFLEV